MPAERNLQFNLVIRKVGGKDLERLVGDLRNVAKSMGAFSGALTGANKALNVANIDRIAGAIERLNTAFAGMGAGVGFKEAAQTLTQMSTAVGALKVQYEQLLAVMNQVAAAQGKQALAAGRSEEENRIRRLSRTIERKTMDIRTTESLIQTEMAHARAAAASGNASADQARKLRSLADQLQRLKASGEVAIAELVKLTEAEGKLTNTQKTLITEFNKAATAEERLAAAARLLAADTKKVVDTQKKQQRIMQQAEVQALGLSKGFDRLIENQLRYIAGAALLFGAINQVSEAWKTQIDLSLQAARSLGTSRSIAMLVEERYAALTKTIEDMTLRTGRAFSDVGEAVYQFGSAGLSVEETMRALKPTMDLIVATDSDVTRTVKTVAATFTMMGNQVAVAGDKMLGFKRIGDIMAASYRDNMIEIQDMNQALKFALPVAQQLNVTFEETSGILAFLHNNFIKAGEAGRSIRSIFQRITSQADEFQRAFGVAFDPQAPLDFMKLLSDLNKRMGSGQLTAEEVGKVFTHLGLRGANAFILMVKRYDELQAVIKRLETTSQGAAKTMAKVRYDSLSGQVAIFKVNLQALVREGFEWVFKAIQTAIEWFNKLATWLKASGIAPFLSTLMKLGAVLLSLKIIVVAFDLILGLIAKKFVVGAVSATAMTAAMEAQTVATEELAVATIAANAAMTTTNGAAVVQVGRMTMLSNVFKGLWASIVKAATGLAAFFATPAGAVVAIILAVVAAVTALYFMIRKITKARQEEDPWREKSLLDLRNETVERRAQIDALEEHRQKLYQLREAYNAGLASETEVRNAIGETGRTFGMSSGQLAELGNAALRSGSNIDSFIKSLEDQQQVLQKTQKIVERVRLEKLTKKFQESKDEVTKLVQESRTLPSVLTDLQQRYQALQKQGGGASSRLLQETVASMDQVRERMRQLPTDINKAQVAFGDLVQTNSDLVPQVGSLVIEIDTLLMSVNATGRAFVKTASAADTARVALQKMSVMDFAADMTEVTRSIENAADRLEDLRLFSLFKLKIAVTDEDIARIRARLESFTDELDAKFIENATILGGTLVSSTDAYRFAMEGVFDSLGQSATMQTEIVREQVQQQIDLYKAGYSTLPGFRDRIARGVKPEELTLIDEQGLERDAKLITITYNKALRDAFNVSGTFVTANVATEEQILRLGKATNVLQRDRMGLLRGQADREEQIKNAKSDITSIMMTQRQLALDEMETRAAASTDLNEQLYLYEAMEEIRNRMYFMANDEQEATNLMVTSQLAVEKAAAGAAEEQELFNRALRQASIVSLNEGKQLDRQFALMGQILKIQQRIADQIKTRIDSTKAAGQDATKYEAELGKATMEEMQTRQSIVQLQLQDLQYREKLMSAQFETLQTQKAMTAIGRSAVGQAWSAMEAAKAQYLIQEELLRYAKAHKYETATILLIEERRIKQQKEFLDAALKTAEQYRTIRKEILSAFKALNLVVTSESKVVELQYQQLDALNELDDLAAEYAKRFSELNWVMADAEKQHIALKEIDAKRLATYVKIAEIETQIADTRFDNLKQTTDLLAKNYKLKATALETAAGMITEASAQAQVASETENVRAAMTDVAKVLNDLELMQKRYGEQVQLTTALQAKIVVPINAAQEALIKQFDLRKKMIKETIQRQIDLEKGVLEALENQRNSIKTISDDLEGRLSEAVQLEFDQSPFNSLLRYSGALNKDWTAIQRLGPQGIAEELAKAIRKGNDPLKYFTGAMGSAVKLLREMNIEQRKLIEAQNQLKEAQLAAAKTRFLGAVDRGDLEGAQSAMESMADAVEQLQVTDFSQDLEKSIGYTTMLTEAAKILAEQYGQSPDQIEASQRELGNLQAVIATIDTTIKNLQTTLAKGVISPETISTLAGVAETLGKIAGMTGPDLLASIKTTADALPMGQMTAVADQMERANKALAEMPAAITKSIEPLKQTVDLLTQLIKGLESLKAGAIEKFEITYQPAIKRMTGGIVPGTGKGDRVPALLEPREYVIPGAAVAAGGTAFFDRLRDPKFVQDLVELLRANGVQGLQVGGGGAGIPAVVGTGPQVTVTNEQAGKILELMQDWSDELVKLQKITVEERNAIVTSYAAMLQRMTGEDMGVELSDRDRKLLEPLLTTDAFKYQWQIFASEITTAVKTNAPKTEALARLQQITPVDPQMQQHLLQGSSAGIERLIKLMLQDQEKTRKQAEVQAQKQQLLSQLQARNVLGPGREQELAAGTIEEIQAIVGDVAAMDTAQRKETLKGQILMNQLAGAAGFAPGLLDKLSAMTEEQLVMAVAMQQSGRENAAKQDELIAKITAAVPQTEAGIASLRQQSIAELQQVLAEIQKAPAVIASAAKTEAAAVVAATGKPAAAGVPLQLQLTPTVDEIKVQLATLSPLVIKTDLDPEGARKAFEQLMAELKPQFEMTLTPKPVIGPPAGMQTGGWVPGTGSGDIVPAMLEPGEFVIPRKAVAALGPSFFEAIQSGGLTKDLQAIQRERQRGTISYGEYFNKIEDLRSEVQHFHGGGFVGGAIGYAGGGPARAPAGTYTDPALKKLWDIEDRLLDMNETMSSINKALDKPLLVKSIQEVVKTETAKPKEEAKAAVAAAETQPAPAPEFVGPPAPGIPGAANVTQLAQQAASIAQAAAAATSTAAGNADRLAAAQAKGMQQGKKWVAEWRNLQDVLKTIGANELSSLKAGFDAFTQNVDAASGEIRKMAGEILEAFGAPFRSAIKAAGDLISDVFMNAIPQAFTFFVNDFIMALADVVKENQAAMKNIQKQYIDSRISLVEQLKRNEISYYDYFNRLEDLNADTQDNMAAAQDDAAARMEAVLSQFTQEFFNQFTSMLQNMTGGFFGFVQDLAGGVGDIATSFFDMFASVGGGIGQLAGMAIGGGIGAGVAGAATGGPGAVIGLAVGAVVGGVIGEVLKSVVPAVGAIFDAFMNVIDGITQGILSLIPVIVKFGTMGEDEFQALLTMLGGTGTDSLMGQIQTFVDNFGRRIDTIIPLLVQRIPELVSALVQAVRVAVPKINEALIALVPMIATTFAQAATELGPVIVTIFDAVAQAAGAAIQAMLETDMVGSFQTMFATIARSIAAVATDIAVPLIAAFMDVAPAFIIGFANAIEASGPMLVEALGRVFLAFAQALPAVIMNPAILDAIGAAAVAIGTAIVEGLFGAMPGLSGLVSLLGLVAAGLGALQVAFVAFQAAGAVWSVLILAIVEAIWLLPLAPLLAVLTAIGVVLGPIVAAFGALAVALGYVLLIKPFITAFEYFADIIQRVMTQLQGSPKVQAAMGKLMDALDRLGAAFGKLMSAIMGTEKNQDVVIAIADAIVWLIEAALPLVDVLVWMADVMTTVVEAGTKVVKFIDDLTAGFGIFAVFGALLAANIIVPIVLLFAPLIAVGAAIAGLIIGLIELQKFLSKVFEPMIAAASRAGRLLGRVVGHAFEAIGRLFMGLITVINTNVVQPLAGILAGILAPIVGVFATLGGIIIGFFTMIGNVLLSLFQPYINAAQQWATDLFNLFAFIGSLPGLLWSGIVAFVNGPLVGAFLILGNILAEIDRVLVGESVVPALEQFLMGLIFLEAVLKAALKPVQDFVNALVNGVLAAFVAVYNFALILADFFVNGLWTAMNDLYNVGMNLFDLLYNNLWTAFNDLISVVKTLIETAGGIVPTPEDVGNAVEAGANTVADVATAAYNATLGQVFGKLHEGGVFNGAYATANMAPNEGIAILQRGEGVISTAGMRNLEQMSGTTGAGALAAIEAGRNPFFGGTAPYQAPYQAPAAGTFTGRQAGGGETVEETDIEVNVSFEGCSFSSEDTANKVEAEITKKLRNRQGNIYTEIRKVKKPKTSAGIRPR